jgi:hypothetical protein
MEASSLFETSVFFHRHSVISQTKWVLLAGPLSNCTVSNWSLHIEVRERCSLKTWERSQVQCFLGWCRSIAPFLSAHQTFRRYSCLSFPTRPTQLFIIIVQKLPISRVRQTWSRTVMIRSNVRTLTPAGSGNVAGQWHVIINSVLGTSCLHKPSSKREACK